MSSFKQLRIAGLILIVVFQILSELTTLSGMLSIIGLFAFMLGFFLDPENKVDE